MTTIALTTCTIRPRRVGDAELLVRHANNPRVAAYLHAAFPVPYTAADAEGWIARNLDLSVTNDFAIEVDGEAAGATGLHLGQGERHHHAEIGYWLGEAYWGRGIATEVVGAMTRYGVERLGLRRLEAHIYEPNLASARVVEKNGDVFERRLGERVVRGETMDLLVYVLVGEDTP